MPARKPGMDQWYVNCAHVNVVGPGGGKSNISETYLMITLLGTPGPLVKIPEVYSASDPGITLPDGVSYEEGLLDYIPPGPPVWNG